MFSLFIHLCKVLSNKLLFCDRWASPPYHIVIVVQAMLTILTIVLLNDRTNQPLAFYGQHNLFLA